MAVTGSHAAQHTFGESVLSAISRFTRALLSSIDSALNANRCGQDAMRLLALSDEQLAQMGLAREDVVAHAFRDFD